MALPGGALVPGWPRPVPVDVSTLLPSTPARRVTCDPGGSCIAVSPDLGLLVVADLSGSLPIYEIPRHPFEPFTLVTTLGQHGTGPLKFRLGEWSGLCFTCHRPEPTLLVADSGNDAVHEIDVLAMAHLEFVTTSLPQPTFVAASPSLIAVLAWTGRLYPTSRLRSPEQPAYVALYDARTMVLLRHLGASEALRRPRGLCISWDEGCVVVGDRDQSNKRLLRYSTTDGQRLEDVVLPFSSCTGFVEVEGGWLGSFTNPDNCIARVPEPGEPVSCLPADVGSRCGGRMFRHLTALVVVPSLGVLVREMYYNRLQLLVFPEAAAPEAVAMAIMSRPRVAWMACVARAVQLRHWQGPQVGVAGGASSPGKAHYAAKVARTVTQP